jgi:very-short-patch-repair endonuclease
MKSSHLEKYFASLWERFGGKDVPVTEHRFHPPRLFRFDFAWPDKKAAVEIEGGLYGKGRHTTVGGFNKDCEKYNLAVLDGWRVLRFTEKMLTSDPLACVQDVRELVGQDIWEGGE